MKRKIGDEELTCTIVRGSGIEIHWNVSNVSGLLHSYLPGILSMSLYTWRTIPRALDIFFMYGRLSVVQLNVAVTSEWLEIGGLVCELLLQPVASQCAGQPHMGLLFSAVDSADGLNLPKSVEFQVCGQLTAFEP